ncbi:Uncharacterised protein [Mycobacteroides abscessus subsp. massiliense]|nr:Uncharacterised protein [Mycobacteroides abscessus subsp. massiliense]
MGVQVGDLVALGVFHRGDGGHLTLKQLSGAIGHHVGCAIGGQPESTREGEHQPGQDHRRDKSATRELREGHGGGYLGGQPLWHRHRVRGIPRGVCGVVDW